MNGAALVTQRGPCGPRLVLVDLRAAVGYGWYFAVHRTSRLSAGCVGDDGTAEIEIRSPAKKLTEFVVSEHDVAAAVAVHVTLVFAPFLRTVNVYDVPAPPAAAERRMRS